MVVEVSRKIKNPISRQGALLMDGVAVPVLGTEERCHRCAAQCVALAHDFVNPCPQFVWMHPRVTAIPRSSRVKRKTSLLEPSTQMTVEVRRHQKVFAY
jgi:hypothetical protein